MESHSTLSILNKWLTRSFAIFWIVFLLLDYIKHHSYYADAINYFSYTGVIAFLIIFFIGLVYFSSSNRKIKPTLKVNGIIVYLFSILILTLLFISFGQTTNLINIDAVSNMIIGEGIFVFIYNNLLHHLWVFGLIISSYSIGLFFINLLKVEFSSITKNLISIGLGFSILLILLFILGIFKLIVSWMVLAILILPIILNYKEVLGFLESILLKKHTIENIHILHLLSVLVLIIYVFFNITSMIRPIPVGFDASNLYMVTPKLISEYNGLTQGGQAYYWSLIMSLGFIIGKNASYALVLSILPGILSVFVIYAIARKYIAKGWAITLSALFYTTPMILFHSTLDAKIDLAALFFILLAVLIFIEKYDSLLEKKPTIIYLLLGWLCGISFGIKYTSLFAIFGFITLFFYLYFNRKGYIGILLLLISLVYGAKLYSFTSISIDESKILYIVIPLSFLGLGLITLSFINNKENINKGIKAIFLYGIAGLLAFSPWACKHLIENKNLSINSIFYGKSPAPTLNKGKAETSKFEKDNSYLRKNFDYSFGSTNKDVKNKKVQNTKNKTEESTSKFEEINRYSGYESGIIKHLSLLYDLTMNTNVNLMHVDLSFLMLMLIPLLALGRPPTEFYLNILKILFLFLLIVFSIYSVYLGEGKDAFIVFNEIESDIGLKKQLINNAFSFSYLTLLSIIFKIGMVLSPIYYFLTVQPYLINVFIILALLVVLFFFYKNFLNELSKKEKLLIAFLTTYFTIWMLIGGGIAWYAMPAISLALLLLLIGINKNNTIVGGDYFINKIVSIAIILWLLSSIPLRLSSQDKSLGNRQKEVFKYELFKYKDNPKYKQAKRQFSKQLDEQLTTINKSIIFPYFAEYLIGKNNFEDIINNINPAYYPAIIEINKDNKLVYKVGTYINYYIEQSDKRVFEDNQLGSFSMLYDKSRDNIELAKRLKKIGFKYIIIDLKTATIDKTPGKTLTAKWKKMQGFISGNTQLKLISSDNKTIAVFEIL